MAAQIPVRPDSSPRIVLVTPAKPGANNGNWHTSARWSEYLGQGFSVEVVNKWTTRPSAETESMMIALHARRSASSIEQFSNSTNPLAVVLTGTDLYRDIHTDADAQRSLDLADCLVVLQAQGLQELSAAHQAKTVVIEQSAPLMPALPKRPQRFDLIMVGHMRAEKDPLTALRAITELPNRALRLRHVGRTDDPQVGIPAMDFAQRDSRIELLGPLNHASARDEIRQAQIMLLPSEMEGGANVLIESVMSDVPVLASRISGSIGMLGESYDGYFPVGDAHALANLIDRCVTDSTFFDHLKAQCRLRRSLFEPARESANVVALAQQLLRIKP